MRGELVANSDMKRQPSPDSIHHHETIQGYRHIVEAIYKLHPMHHPSSIIQHHRRDNKQQEKNIIFIVVIISARVSCQ
jgi:hypothetical protein